MVNNVYFVSWYLHNKDNDGWAYKVENKYATVDAARKAYHTLLGNYEGGDVYDSVSAILSDAYGNVIAHEWWGKADEPEPNVED